MRTLNSAALILFVATAAHAHTEGFHVRLAFTLSQYGGDGLVTMDVSSGERSRLLRAGADLNRDGRLDGDEVLKLENRLRDVALKGLKLSFSKAPVGPTVKGTKLNLHNDKRVSKAGLSVAVLLDLTHPHAVEPGMRFEVEMTTPDASHVFLEVFQHSEDQAAAEPDFRADVRSGERTEIRLGKLKNVPAKE